MTEKELKPYQKPEFKQALRTGLVVLAVAAVAIIAAIIFG